jgi:PAS domain-containing protein
MTSARLPGGESVAAATAEERAPSPLKDVQLMSRGEFAPFFAAANIMAAILFTAALWGSARSEFLLPWTALVGACNFAAMRWAQGHAVTCVGRSGRPVPPGLMIGDVLARAAVWLSLPLWLFPSLSPANQLIAGSLIAGVGVAGLGLVVVPACASAWMCAFTGGLALALLLARSSMPFQHMLAILFTLGVSIFGVLIVARWAFDQLKTNATMGSQSESASLLLQEYEQRGVGWLWQIDGENRVTYISSRMSALLGKPSSQLLGQSLPALLACCSPSSLSPSSTWRSEPAAARAGSPWPATRSSTRPAGSKASAA